MIRIGHRHRLSLIAGLALHAACTAGTIVSEEIEELLGDIPIQNVSHEQFKHRTHSSKAVIRTGEFTPYANIILVAGVVF